jgi:molybdate transport system substrate-binding protein
VRNTTVAFDVAGAFAYKIERRILTTGKLPDRGAGAEGQTEKTTMSKSHPATSMRMIIVLSALLAWPVAASAQVKVLISGGFSGAYERLLPEFERTSGIKVMTGSGSSQGDGPQTIKAQLARGVPADMVILSKEGLNELIAASRIAIGTDKDLARTGLGVAVLARSPKPDLSTVDAVKQALLNAKAIAIPGSTGGIWLTTNLFPRLGIAEKVRVKLTARGTDATGMVAAGTAELAVMPVSEILHASGVDFAGALPAEIQFVQTFSAAIVAGSNEMQGAKRLIEFLASTDASEAIRNSGLEPLATSR